MRRLKFLGQMASVDRNVSLLTSAPTNTVLAVSMPVELGSTRAPGCADRRPRRSEFGASRSPRGDGIGRLVWSARTPTTAREDACAPRFNCAVTAWF